MDRREVFGMLNEQRYAEAPFQGSREDSVAEPHGSLTRHVHRVCHRHTRRDTQRETTPLSQLKSYFRAPICLPAYVHSYAYSQPFGILSSLHSSST